VHMFLHLSESVAQLGPLWLTSCFMFEDMNGRVGRLVHGTRHPAHQICSNLSIVTKLPLVVSSVKNEKVKIFCLGLRFKSMQLNVSEKISDDMSVIGDLKNVSDDTIFVTNFLSQMGFTSEGSTVKVFDRLCKNKILFVSSRYKVTLQDSSFVKYMCSGTYDYGKIITFVKVENLGNLQYLAIVEKLQVTTSFETENVQLTHIFQLHEPSMGLQIVDVLNLTKVMFSVQSGTLMYLAEPLNNAELE